MPPTPTFPNNSDGDALRLVLESGSDLSRPMTVDFHVAAPTESIAQAVAAACNKLSYRASASLDQGHTTWTTTCTTRMVLNYDSVIAMQAELHAIVTPLGAKPDGWGTFGNGQKAHPNVKM